MELTTAAAEFVVAGAVPLRVLRRTQRAVLDTLAVALAGAEHEDVDVLRRWAVAAGRDGECAIWGVPCTTSVQAAALINASAAHVLDFDDATNTLPGHPTSPVLGAAFALAQARAATGHELLDGVTVGVEVMCQLGHIVGRAPFENGWHVTAVLGSIGAAAACSRLLGFDRTTTARALGLAAVQSAGTRASFGSGWKAFQVGKASSNGVIAAELARGGLSSSPNALSDPAGMLSLIGPSTACTSDVTAMFGEPFDIEMPGHIYKPFPCCVSAHASVAAAIALHLLVDDVDRIVSVQIDVPYTVPLMLVYHNPATVLEAKFSLEYCVATALRTGRLGLDLFTLTAIVDSTVRALMNKIVWRVPKEWSEGGDEWNPGASRVVVTLGNGDEVQREVTASPGSAQQPLSKEEIVAKASSCASRALGSHGAEKFVHEVDGLVTAPSLSPLGSLLYGAGVCPVVDVTDHGEELGG